MELFEREIQCLSTFIDEAFPEETACRISYRRWVAEKILFRIREESSRWWDHLNGELVSEPIDIACSALEQYEEQLDHCKKPKHKRILLAAVEVADCVVDLLEDLPYERN